MITRTADRKGRITLGSEFAGKRFFVWEEAGEIVLVPAAVIPEREAWLYQNPEAIQSVQSGLEQARSGQFVAIPSGL
jgi:hypothetical protein